MAGYIDFNKKTQVDVLKEMTDVLHHRGPDDCGLLTEEFENCTVALGHRRLSILDLSAHGHQPMSYMNLTIVYNGEVYNFKEIRNELIEENYTFDSDSDTEVLLKGWHRWGPKLIGKLNGMFALVILDKTQQKVILLRDRAGVKPLYWYFENGVFLFASELKSFHKHDGFNKKISNEGLRLFFQYGYIPQPFTIFEGGFKLESGHYLVIDIVTKNIQKKCYWNVSDCYDKPKFDISENEAIDRCESLLSSACEYRMVADVPVGIFLSGGYDSSAVAALLQANRANKLKTFTIGFNEESFNEAQYAKNTANYLGTDHIEYYCTSEDAKEILPILPDIWDEPFADPSAIPTILVSRLARKDVTVSLSADGGDELFGGYDKYTAIKRKKDLFNKIPSVAYPAVKALLKSKLTQQVFEYAHYDNAADRLERLANMIGQDESGLLKTSSCVFTDTELQHLFTREVLDVHTAFDERLNGNWLDNILAIDYKTYQVDNILTKVDRATMSCSLEGREPLLDYKLIEFVARLDPQLKIKNNCRKYILKKIVHKYIPQSMLDRPKQGFGIPVSDWLGDQLKVYVSYYLDENRIAKSEILNPHMVRAICKDYFSGNNNKVNFKKIWFLLMFEMWREKWM
ncbi:asparagine synthase (glutamine-hydrolyzing) [Xenorhabdus khoisanae]|nr:asparagine synthase (glutamine-hydrolyzing) [Xenorhabdus khoisanae]